MEGSQAGSNNVTSQTLTTYSPAKRVTILNEKFIIGAKGYRDIKVSIPEAKSADISGKMYVDGDSYIRLLSLDTSGKSHVIRIVLIVMTTWFGVKIIQ